MLCSRLMEYQCATCEARCRRLWRPYNFPHDSTMTLLCRACAEKEQHVRLRNGRIGDRVPAIPRTLSTEPWTVATRWWEHPPAAAVEWWERMPE